jgi:hypothetical protein
MKVSLEMSVLVRHMTDEVCSEHANLLCKTQQALTLPFSPKVRPRALVSSE